MDGEAVMTRTETDVAITIEVDHGYVDDKGRAIGGRATIGKTLSVHEGDGEETTRGYSLITRALRAGHEFGVSSYHTYHQSIADAEEFAQRQLAAQAKRFRKRYGVVP